MFEKKYVKPSVLETHSGKNQFIPALSVGGAALAGVTAALGDRIIKHGKQLRSI